jgi:hypothetical protein
VPVYLGPENITEHVPAEAFVDARAFGSYEELYDFLLSVEPEDYERYLAAAREFIASGRARQFTDEGCADVLIRQLRCEREATAVPGLGVRRARSSDA